MPYPSGVPRVAGHRRAMEDEYFKRMEGFSNRFVRATHGLASGRAYARQWVTDPFHAAFRFWEYPFCAFHLERWRRAAPRLGCAPRVLDAGCGFTFFPPFLMASGWDVSCCDIDAQWGRAYAEAGCAGVRFGAMDIQALSWEADAFDAVVCVSVAEHLPRPDRAVAEIFRVLRPGGIMCLTFDFGVDGLCGLSPAAAVALVDDAAALFGAALPDAVEDLRRIHVAREDFLTTDWLRLHCPKALPWRLSPRQWIGALLRGRWPRAPFHSLSVCCVSLEKPPCAS